MAGPGRTDVLAVAAELERRDEEQAAALAQLAELAGRIDALRRLGAEVRELLARVPDELAKLDESEREARSERERAAAEVAEAERRRADAEAGFGAAAEQVETARAALAAAQDRLTAADRRLARLSARRDALLAEGQRARADGERLAHEARELAAALAAAPRVSAIGATPPGRGLDGVAEWGERAHAALLVARAALEGERERTIREAAELGSAALGEPVWLGSVAAIRRRLQRELGS